MNKQCQTLDPTYIRVSEVVATHPLLPFFSFAISATCPLLPFFSKYQPHIFHCIFLFLISATHPLLYFFFSVSATNPLSPVFLLNKKCIYIFFIEVYIIFFSTSYAPSVTCFFAQQRVITNVVLECVCVSIYTYMYVRVMSLPDDRYSFSRAFSFLTSNPSACVCVCVCVRVCVCVCVCANA